MRDSDSARQLITNALFTAVLAMFAYNVNLAANLITRHDPNRRPYVASFEKGTPVLTVRLSDLANAHHCETCKGGGR